MKVFAMLYLQSEQFIAAGKTRRVYHHPTNPHLVVKVPINRAGEGKFLRICATERKIYEKAGRPRFLAGIYGSVETTMGPGALCEKIEGLTLEQHVLAHGMYLDFVGKYRALCDQIERCDVFCSDMSAQNIICNERGLVIVDGTHDRKKFRISRLFRFLRKHRMRRKFRRLGKALECLNDRKTDSETAHAAGGNVIGKVA